MRFCTGLQVSLPVRDSCTANPVKQRDCSVEDSRAFASLSLVLLLLESPLESDFEFAFSIMSSTNAFLLGLLGLTTALAVPAGQTKDHVTIPLTQRRTGNTDAYTKTLHAVSRHGLTHNAGFAIAPETLDAGFWYGIFSIGDSNNLSLLIDTGSTDLAVNPELYTPSPKSHNLHQRGRLQFYSAQADGCGFADVKYKTFTDEACFAGMTSRNQTLAEVVKTPPPNHETISKFPHDGLVGLGGTNASQTVLGGTPFFQQLCDQGAVKECRFGIAYGTEGRGKQILGGVDSELYHGELAFSPINTTYSTVSANGTVVYENEHGSGELKHQQFFFVSLME